MQETLNLAKFNKPSRKSFLFLILNRFQSI